MRYRVGAIAITPWTVPTAWLFVSCLITFPIRPATAQAESERAEYRAAGSALELLRRGAMRIAVLVDSAVLGGPEFEMAEITFPPASGAPGRHHGHGTVEMIYVLSGELDHVVNGLAHRLRPGMVGIVRPPDSVAHRVVSGHPVRALVIWAPAGELGHIRAGFEPSLVANHPLDDLDRLRQAWIEAYQRGDSGDLMDLYTEDAARMPYDVPQQTGRDAVLAAYEAGFAARAFDPTLTLQVDELLETDGLALERGRYREILRSRSGPQVLVEEGKYVTLVQLGEDGRWRYRWSIFNRDSARPMRPEGR